MTLAALTNQIVDWMDRDDIEAKVVIFAHLAQADAVRHLSIREMEKSKTVDVFNDGSVTVPVDTKQAISMSWVTTEEGVVTVQKPLKRASVYQYKLSLEEPWATEPDSFTRIGNNYYVFPIPTESVIVDNVVVGTKVVGKVNFSYYAYPLELSTYTETNWMLQYYPDLMFYGCMMHANRYIRDFEQSSFWEGQFQRLLNSIQKESDLADESGGVWELHNGD